MESSRNSFTTSSPPISLEQLKKVAELLSNIGPEPIGEWMRKQGFPPETYFLALPASYRGLYPVPAFWPSYVRFSDRVREPFFVRHLTT